MQKRRVALSATGAPKKIGRHGDKDNCPKRRKFLELIQNGVPWTPALNRSGLGAVEAAQMVDILITTRRDGVSIWLLSEKYLFESMEALKKLAKSAGDEKVRLLAACKLSDTAYKILVHKPYLEKINSLAPVTRNNEPDCFLNTSVWDASFEEGSDVCTG